MASGETGKRLGKLIKKAIEDLELTTTEYDRILAMAHADGVVDDQEQKLLSQLQEMLSNGTVKRVPG